MSGHILLFEPREGGRYRIELTHQSEGAGKSSAKSDISAGRFLALEPGRRIVQSVEFESHDPAFAGEMVMTWTFAPAPAVGAAPATEVTVAAGHVPPGISAEDHWAAWPPASPISHGSSNDVPRPLG